MKNLTAKQIEQIKLITPFSSVTYHGNRKKVGYLPIELHSQIVAKKLHRFNGNCVLKNGKVFFQYQFKKSQKTNLQILRSLINWSKECKGTNYFKVLIEGNTGIYYAHPGYGHSDYNKSRVFEKTPETLKLMALFNAIVNK